MTYIDNAKNHCEQSQGDVTEGYNKSLKEWATIEALIAIAEQLERLNNKLDAVTSLSGSAVNINR